MSGLGKVVRGAVTPWRRVLHSVDGLDRAVFEAIAGSHSPVMDSLMPKISRAADYSMLWMALGAGMSGTKNQRLVWAAQRGLTGVAVTSLLTNQIAKRAHARPRPLIAEVPLARRALRLPTSSSFPSGHSASAAAFAAGVAAEHPVAGVFAQGLAALVGFSRIATGAHYPSDVVVGFGIGAAVSTIGAKMVPPVPVPRAKPQDPLLLELPKRPGGEGLIVVINPMSGSGTGERVLAEVEKLLPRAEIVRLGPGDDLEERLADAASRCEVLGVAGGDGTIRAAASLASQREIPLAVFPAGTFNHFARSVGVGVRETARAIETGQCTKVDVARLNGEVFLNTASAGSYPQFVQLRESLEHKVGKPLAATAAALRLLVLGKPFRVRYDGREYTLAAIFVGNGRYDPPGFAPLARMRMDDGLLDLRLLETGKPFATLRTLLALSAGRLGWMPLYHEVQVPQASLEVVGDAVPFARDGEVTDSGTTMEFTVDYRGLTLFRPFDAKARPGL